MNFFFHLFIVELLVAELMFLFPMERKRRFWTRLAFALGVSFAWSVAVSLPFWDKLIPMRSLVRFFQYTSRFFVSAVALNLCFEGGFFSVLSLCASGYASQHCAARVFGIANVIFPLQRYGSGYFLMEIGCDCVIYVLFYLLFAKKISGLKKEWRTHRFLGALAITMVLICTGLSRFFADYGEQLPRVAIGSSLYAITCCVFALIIQYYFLAYVRSEVEATTSQRIISEQARQFEQWESSLELINTRYHDLRHMLDAVREQMDLTEMETALDTYGAIVQTGNEMLDVLLTGKKLVCDSRKISFTCMVEKNAMSDLEGIEIYSLFCNAMDNAIEAVGLVQEPEKRVIDLNIHRSGDLVSARLQNYYSGTVQMMDGLPVTRHEEAGHGYGMKSIRDTAVQFGGTVSIVANDDVFSLLILLPACPDRDDIHE